VGRKAGKPDEQLVRPCSSSQIRSSSSWTKKRIWMEVRQSRGRRVMRMSIDLHWGWGWGTMMVHLVLGLRDWFGGDHTLASQLLGLYPFRAVRKVGVDWEEPRWIQFQDHRGWI
jgi:hypothetical protein